MYELFNYRTSRITTRKWLKNTGKHSGISTELCPISTRPTSILSNRFSSRISITLSIAGSVHSLFHQILSYWQQSAFVFQTFEIKRKVCRKMMTVLQNKEWKDVRSSVTPVFTSGKIKLVCILKLCYLDY